MIMNEIEAKCKELRQLQNLIEEAQQAFPEVAQAFAKATTTRRFCVA